MDLLRLQIYPLPILKDNYVWILMDEATQCAVIVDPGDAAPIEAFLIERQLTLCGVLITHHHWDHTNGLKDLIAAREIPVVGPAQETIPGITLPAKEGQAFTLPDFPVTFSVLDIPGHTLGHVAYLLPQRIFCGDTLFASGCGRLFEGTAQQLYDSLQKIAALPDDTAIFCAHEYTLNNLRFAALVEPDNAQVRERFQRVEMLRSNDLPSLPSLLADEKNTNPFLRCHIPAVIQSVEKYADRSLKNPVDVFTWLRKWKDRF